MYGNMRSSLLATLRDLSLTMESPDCHIGPLCDGRGSCMKVAERHRQYLCLG